jgi:hypothetical protein
MAATKLAVISFDGVHLLLPQQAVATIEMTSSIVSNDSPGESPGESIGQLKTTSGAWPAYALQADFNACTQCPARYRYCVAINRDSKEAFSIACEEVSSITIENDDELRPLQTCMRTLGSPIESVMIKGNKLMLFSNVETMQRFLSRRAAA